MTIDVADPKYFVAMHHILVLGPKPTMQPLHPVLYAPNHSKELGFWHCDNCKATCIANRSISHQKGCKKKVLSYGFGPQEDISRSPLPPELALRLFAFAMATVETQIVEKKLHKSKNRIDSPPIIRFQRACSGEFLKNYYETPPPIPEGIGSGKTLLTKDDDKSIH